MSNIQATVLTPEVVKTKMALALMKVETGIQTLADLEANLTIDEDHLQETADFIKKIKDAKKIVEDERILLKNPSLEDGRNIDAGAKLITSEIVEIEQRVAKRYNALCAEITTRKRNAEIEEKRVAEAQALVNNNILIFSQKIADCKTDDELVVLEKALGAEKRKTIYQEFLPDMVKRIDDLRPLITAQKEAIRTLSKLSEAEEKAITAGDDQALLEVTEKKEAVEAKIQENRQVVQESAITQTLQNRPSGVTQVFAKIPSGGRKTWSYELIDAREAMKKAPDMLDVTLNSEKAKQQLKTLHDTGILKSGEKEEYTINGIRYYLKQSF